MKLIFTNRPVLSGKENPTGSIPLGSRNKDIHITLYNTSSTNKPNSIGTIGLIMKNIPHCGLH